MRCPYCGGLNSERASFCAQCGRDLPQAQANPRQQPHQPSRQQPQPASPYQPAQRQGAPQPPQQQPRAPQPTPIAVPARQASMPPPPRVSQFAPPQQVAEVPANFPPRTMVHLKALQSEAVPFTLLDDAIVDKRKKVVRIVYRRCTPWQQIATLFKAFSEQDTKGVETVLVQGIIERETTPYEFSNGQLRFDRAVRLGSQTINRFQIETGNGFENDSLRVVLSE